MSNSVTVSPVQPSFPVRRMDYAFNDVPKYWFDNDPVSTLYFIGLSLLFPEGESFFVRSVRAVRNQLKQNPQLDRDVGAFIGQEAMHSKEHQAFHVSARQYNLDPDSLEQMTGKILKTIEGIAGKKINLLITVGLEHYTAVKVVNMMNGLYQSMTDETIQNLWLWHSVEETEHKAIAFDVYQYLYGTGVRAYVDRVAVFTVSLSLILDVSIVYTLVLAKRDQQLTNWRSWQKFIG
ncbi:MAG: metal-dependent hydrolase, partial [Pseudomonadota bacterium]|nr:metal-dependent hydrolase [Pseudomonadota bacterium]